MARIGSRRREQLELEIPCGSPHGGPADGGEGERMLILTGGDMLPPGLPSMNIQTTHRLRPRQASAQWRRDAALLSSDPNQS